MKVINVTNIVGDGSVNENESLSKCRGFRRGMR